MKKHLKKLAFLFATVIILSCTNERDFVNKENHHLKISEKSFDELSRLTNFSSALKKIPKNRPSSSNATDSRSAIEEEFDFTFSDKPAKVIEGLEKTSYTFLINRTLKDTTFFENLIVEINKQMKARAVILKYTPIEPLIIEQENKVGFEGNIISIKLFDEINPNDAGWVMTTCYLVYGSLCVTPPDCGGMICGFGVRNLCTTAEGPSGGGGGGGGGGSTPVSTVDTPTSPTNISNNYTGDDITTVIVPPQWQLVLWKNFKKSLSTEQRSFLNSFPSPISLNSNALNALESKIEAYLISEGYSVESTAFAKELIDGHRLLGIDATDV